MAADPPSSTSDVCLYFLGLFLPPLAVFLKTGCDSNFLINILLTILAWLPGVIHAWFVQFVSINSQASLTKHRWVISKHERPAADY